MEKECCVVDFEDRPLKQLLPRYTVSYEDFACDKFQLFSAVMSLGKLDFDPEH
ncbi:MAG: hypothetical protein VXY05_03815 [Pseudomonadota bacterium]|jgi:hypothetical protein|nr:hypothetical protein [Pseudomonadota bacterium]